MSWLMCRVCKHLYGNAHVAEAMPNWVQNCPKCYPDKLFTIVEDKNGLLLRGDRKEDQQAGSGRSKKLVDGELNG